MARLVLAARFMNPANMRCRELAVPHVQVHGRGERRAYLAAYV